MANVQTGVTFQVATGRADQCIGWRGTSTAGHMSYRYQEFRGLESRPLRGRAGAVLAVDYAATIERGNLRLELQRDDGTPVWQCCLRGTDRQSATIPLPDDGAYLVKVIGHDTSGAFDLRWSVEEGQA